MLIRSLCTIGSYRNALWCHTPLNCLLAAFHLFAHQGVGRSGSNRRENCERHKHQAKSASPSSTFQRHREEALRETRWKWKNMAFEGRAIIRSTSELIDGCFLV